MRDPDIVVIEIKPGPYQANEFCDWGGEPDAVSYLSRLASAQPGQKGESI
jgi:hypothetical protein